VLLVAAVDETIEVLKDESGEGGRESSGTIVQKSNARREVLRDSNGKTSRTLVKRTRLWKEEKGT